MAIPRIFVSSTCYDLQEIRSQLRNFIKEFGYEPALSEFDDIFYNYDKHVQDSCLEEIPKCQLFILVVGDNYGSLYHRDSQNNKTPDSVTLAEFRKALEQDVCKHIFVSKFVDYDYKNYKRALEKDVLKYFKENDVSDDKVKGVRQNLKEQFDSSYHFPRESYKFVFYFLDVIYNLAEGTAVSSFESFNDIKESLKKQWAGLIYEALSRKGSKENIISSLEDKILNIDKNLNKLINSKTSENGVSLTFDISNLARNIDIEALTELKSKIQNSLWNICNFEEEDNWGNTHWEKRIAFNKRLSDANVKEWLEGLQSIVRSYKWSNSINAENLFEGIPLKNYNRYNSDINYKLVLELYSIYDSLSDGDDKDSFVSTVCQEFNKCYEMTNPTIVQEAPGEEDDLPF